MPGNGRPGFVGNSCSGHTEQLFVWASCLLKKLYALTFMFFCANAPFLILMSLIYNHSCFPSSLCCFLCV